MQKNWKKEIARDIVALGGIPFYMVIIARATVIRSRYPLFIYQLLIAAFVLFILSKIIRKSNLHIARGLILAVFSTVFYKDFIYTIFASMLWICMIFSLSYLKLKNKEIAKGISLGALSTLISYYLSPLL